MMNIKKEFPSAKITDSAILNILDKFNHSIVSDIQDGAWDNVLHTYIDYLSWKRESINSLNSMVNPSFPASKTHPLENLLILLSDEAVIQIYLALIYSEVVINNNNKSGMFLFERMQMQNPCTIHLSEFAWYMALKCELSGVKGMFEFIRKFHKTRDLESSLSYIRITPLLLDLAGKHHSLHKAIVRHLFVTMESAVSIDGLLGIEEPLKCLVSDLLEIKCSDISVWERLFSDVACLNGIDCNVNNSIKESSPNSAPDTPRLLSILIDLNWGLTGTPDITSIVKFTNSIFCKRPHGKSLLEETQLYVQKLNSYTKFESLITIINLYEHLHYHNREYFEPLLHKTLLFIFELQAGQVDSNSELLWLTQLHSICALLEYKIGCTAEARTLIKKAQYYCADIKNAYVKAQAVGVRAWAYLHMGQIKIARHLLCSLVKRNRTKPGKEISSLEIEYLSWLFDCPEFLKNHQLSVLVDVMDLSKNGSKPGIIKVQNGHGFLNKKDEFHSKSALSNFIQSVLQKQSKATLFNLNCFLGSIVEQLIASGSETAALQLIDNVKKRISSKDEYVFINLFKTVITELSVRSIKYQNVWRSIIEYATQFRDKWPKVQLVIFIAHTLQKLGIDDLADFCWMYILDLLKNNAALKNVSVINETIFHLKGRKTNEVLYERLLEVALENRFIENNSVDLVDALDILSSSPKLFIRFRDTALKIAETEENMDKRIRIYRILISGYALIGDLELASFYLQRAVSLINASGPLFDIDSCLLEIVRGYCTIGLIEKALVIACRVKTIRMKVKALIIIASTYTREGEIKESYIIAERIYEIIEEETSDIDRELCLNLLFDHMDEIVGSGMYLFFERIFYKIETTETTAGMLNIVSGILDNNETLLNTPSSYRWMDLLEEWLSNNIFKKISALRSDIPEFTLNLHKIITIMQQLRLSETQKWLMILKLCSRVETESDRVSLFTRAADTLLYLEAVNIELLKYFRVQERGFQQIEYHSQFQYTLIKLYLEAGESEEAFRTVREIQDRKWRELAAVFVINHTTNVNSIDIRDTQVIEVFKLLKDNPDLFMSLLIPRLVHAYQFKVLEQFEPLIEMMLRDASAPYGL